MSKKGHTEEQILRALRQAESGAKGADICREHGVSEATYYVWKKALRRPGAERVTRIAPVARGEQQAEAAGGGSLAGPAHAAGDRTKKAVKPRHRRELGRWTQATFAVSERRVAGLLPIQLATLRYRSRRDPQLELRLRLRELAANRVRFGYRRLTVLLRREGWPVNAKRIYRLYAEDGLAVRTKAVAAFSLPAPPKAVPISMLGMLPHAHSHIDHREHRAWIHWGNWRAHAVTRCQSCSGIAGAIL